MTLLTLRDTIEELKVVIRICKEVKAFKSFSSFQYAAESVVSLGKQSEGWIKSVQQRSSATGRNNRTKANKGG
ncbi:MAG: hypothetical protein HZA10_01280 [Nitrospirae bacterium]|nr:hypothetical protein [Nitrospirota bacterium]